MEGGRHPAECRGGYGRTAIVSPQDGPAAIDDEVRLARVHPAYVVPDPPAPSARSALAQRLLDASTQLESDLGGREQMVASLLTSPIPPEIEPLVALLADPAHEQVPLHQIAQLAGSSLPAFLHAYQTAVLMRARLTSLHHVAEGLPAVAEGSMTLATVRQDTCGRCKGIGTVNKRGRLAKGETEADRIVECPTCFGQGTTQITPKVDQQRLALELGGLVEGRSAAVAVNVTQNQAQFAVPGGDLVAMQRAVHQILSGPARNRPI